MRGQRAEGHVEPLRSTSQEGHKALTLAHKHPEACRFSLLVIVVCREESLPLSLASVCRYCNCTEMLGKSKSQLNN